jgi:hypothetical protein
MINCIIPVLAAIIDPFGKDLLFLFAVEFDEKIKNVITTTRLVKLDEKFFSLGFLIFITCAIPGKF